MWCVHSQIGHESNFVPPFTSCVAAENEAMPGGDLHLQSKDNNCDMAFIIFCATKLLKMLLVKFII